MTMEKENTISETTAVISVPRISRTLSGSPRPAGSAGRKRSASELPSNASSAMPKSRCAEAISAG